jgi:hypothetical protein
MEDVMTRVTTRDESRTPVALGSESLTGERQQLARRGRAHQLEALFRSGGAAARLCEPEP